MIGPFAISDPAKIDRMDITEAWKNYKNAMDVVLQARRSGRPHTAAHWRSVAEHSLDVHFARTDAWLTQENKCGAWSAR